MRRINGFIDVDKMLQDIGAFSPNEMEIIKNPKIECHSDTTTDLLIEFNYNNETYFFKYNSSSIPYNELIAYELANDFGLNCVEYDLAKLLDKEGVLSKNYKKENTNYISGEQILLDYLNDNDALFVLFHNNLDDIWGAFEYRYRDYPNKKEIVERLMKKIVSIFIFDIITCQADRHSSNWEVEECVDLVDIGPLFDNERILTSSGKNLNSSSKKAYVLLTVNDVCYGDLFNELRAFFKVSEKSFSDLLKEKLWIINEENLKSVFKRVEDKTGYVISESEKQYYFVGFKNHKEMLEKELMQYENNLERDDQNERKNR